ncbi:MAG: hypothetical protein IJ743_02220 [Bacilli bacterium]|nr:hypothetical protein [Bacilli bacterium]
MREDRIVNRSKNVHKYKKKKTVPALVPIIAAGIIAVTSFNLGAYCERHDIHFFEQQVERSQPGVQVEEEPSSLYRTYEDVMASQNNEAREAARQEYLNEEHEKFLEEQRRMEEYNQRLNQQQVDEFGQHHEGGRGL